MKPIAVAMLFLALVLSQAVPAASPVPRPPSVAGEGHILMAARTGRILAEGNPDARLKPASLTKIMTAYVVYHALEDGRIALDDEVVVSEAAWRTGGSRMFLEVGSRVLVDQLLDGMVIQSGNDASLTLAEHVAGGADSFAELMNSYAAELGMENSNFTNPHGLPHENQYTSARDMALLTRALIREFPQHYQRYSELNFSYNNIEQYNRNELLRVDDSVDGVKTGYTSAAGYSLVSSARRGEMRLISVVMGSPSVQRRTSDSRALLNWGFRFFDTHRLFDVGETIEEARVWEGVQDSLAIGPAEPIHVTVPTGEYENLDAELTLPDKLVAPVREGEELGRVVVRHDGETLVDAPAVALAGVEQAGFVQRIIDRVWQWFEE